MDIREIVTYDVTPAKDGTFVCTATFTIKTESPFSHREHEAFTKRSLLDTLQFAIYCDTRWRLLGLKDYINENGTRTNPQEVVRKIDRIIKSLDVSDDKPA